MADDGKGKWGGHGCGLGLIWTMNVRGVWSRLSLVAIYVSDGPKFFLYMGENSKKKEGGIVDLLFLAKYLKIDGKTVDRRGRRLG